MKVLVTGASGFVGSALCRRLAAAGHDVTGTVRAEAPAASWMRHVRTGDLTERRDLSDLVGGMDAVVHLAARVHMMHETASDPEEIYRRANAETTERLAEAAAAAGVSRFVLMSSVKVNGEATYGTPYTEAAEPDPQDAYGRSKLLAEQALDMSAERPMTAVALRTPLIYGAGVKANFRSLMRLCATRMPLPLDGLTDNRRSLLFLGNLTHAIERVLTAESAPAGVYLLCDGEDLSTAALVERLRFSLRKPTLPLSIPGGLLRNAAGALGRSAAADRLCGSLQIDAAAFRSAYGWTSPYSVGQGFAATASAFCAAV